MQLYQHPDGSRDRPPDPEHRHGQRPRTGCRSPPGRRFGLRDRHLPAHPRDAPPSIVGRHYVERRRHRSRQYAIRAMSEHCRAATLLVGDGVVPSNEGRGYVLRRVIRRAVYLARRSGVTELFTARLADAAIDKLKVGYPHLDESRRLHQAGPHHRRRALRPHACRWRRLASNATRPARRCRRPQRARRRGLPPLRHLRHAPRAHPGDCLARRLRRSTTRASRRPSKRSASDARASREVPQGRGFPGTPVPRRRAQRLRRLRPH